MEKQGFNIKVGYGKKEVKLTIFKEKDYYKVIYFGCILGAVRYVHDEWISVSTVELLDGDHPEYAPDLTGERLTIVFDENTAAAIGKEIECLAY